MKAFRQTVVVDVPPCFARCVQAFGRENVDRRGVIFAWGTKIYNPFNVSISRELGAHEAVHGMRQIGEEDLARGAFTDDSIWVWWERYLTDPLFRLNEELYAHHAEYKAGVRRHGHRPRDFNAIAERLAGPLYGNLITIAQAKHAVLTGVVSLDPSREEPLQRSAA
jgi:hypothetical protein